MSRSVRRASLVLVAAASLSVAGCFGSFNLTRTIYKFNQDVSENQWVQELTFIGLAWLPVYSLGTLGDAIIFNSIEFWTGDNPISVDGSGDGDTARVFESDEGRASLELLADGRIRVEVDRTDGGHETFVLDRSAAGVTASDESGALLARVADGELVTD